MSKPIVEKVALRYGPLIYNIEQVDQDITKSLSATATLTTEWRPDLLGGVMVFNGQFADGSAMMAVPNYVRMNREPVPPPPPPVATPVTPPAPGATPPPRPPRRITSTVWITES